ncbi:MAG: 16S rRNA (guanine(966)-N(2))-methyltransferase RsmD [Deltaproteobacteria bacterium]|nr:MAG: 16S rRNA (guanine(966)-N(2))-methyltransferase RsmD [Deltaproteobacteria bacterium]
MRIISGSAKGRTLFGPKTNKIRPALDKVKQAVYNILYDVTDLKVLDLFAGTGSVGLEAISRGAQQCVFVDDGKESLDIVHKNIELCRFQNQSVVLKRKIPDKIDDVFKNFGPFDLIFVDPPYDQNLVVPSLKKIAREKPLKENGLIIVEHSPREVICDIEGLIKVDERKYGQTVISILKI